MIFRKDTKSKINSEELLKMAGQCSPKKLKDLLKQIDGEIARGNEEDHDLQMARTIITSRLTSMRDTGKMPL